jgi:lipopolysaccharide export system permease protein
MKKIDRLILGAFIGPFILTTAVVVFILLIQQLMQQLEHLLGKGVSYFVFAELCFYFSVHIVPLALPLAILLSALITFGNLGEHMELTALKGAGISLTRVLAPIFIFTIFISVGSFWFNDRVVPAANLEAYRMLWDIKQKSPSLSIKEGAFYNGLQGYSIKVNKKFTDGKSIKDVMIYDHTDRQGNNKLILADSGRMYTIRNDRFLVLELFKGKSYDDKVAMQDGNNSNQKFLRSQFDKSQVVFNLSSFDMQSTDPGLFKQHRFMRSASQLALDVDSINRFIQKSRKEIIQNLLPNYRYHLKEDIKMIENQSFIKSTNLTRDNDVSSSKSVIQKSKDTSLVLKQNTKDTMLAYKRGAERKRNQPITRKLNRSQGDSVTTNQVALQSQDTSKQYTQKKKLTITTTTTSNKIVEKVTKLQQITRALSQARSLASFTKNYATNANEQEKQAREFTVELYKKYTLAFACISMFLIGAPLGSIIKKGGLGVPVLVSILFFILFYVLSITGEKWVKEGFVHVLFGMSMSNVVLLAFGFLFLSQARNDSRLFETDFYLVWWDNIKKRFRKKAA